MIARWDPSRNPEAFLPELSEIRMVGIQDLTKRLEPFAKKPRRRNNKLSLVQKLKEDLERELPLLRSKQ